MISQARLLGMKTLFYDVIALTHRQSYPPEFVAAFVEYCRMMREAEVIIPILFASGEALKRFYQSDSSEAIGEADPMIQPCPVAGEFISTPRRREVGRPEHGMINILCVGTIEPRKNQLRLTEALEPIWRSGKAGTFI